MRLLFFTVIFSFLMSFAGYAKPPASAFGQLPKVGDASISPDGKMVAAFVAQGDGYGLGVYHIDGSGKEPIGLGLGEGIKPSWVEWANDDIILASIWRSQKFNGTPFTSGFIYAFDVKKKEGSILIDPSKAGRKSISSRLATTGVYRQSNNDVIDFLPNDPDHILMSFSDINVRAPDVQKVNVRTGKYKVVRRGSEDIQRWLTDLRGEVRLMEGNKSETKAKWTMKIRDADGEKWRHVDEYPGLSAEDIVVGFTRDPNELVLALYRGKDTRGLYVYDLLQKSITRTLFHNDKYDVEALLYNADRSDIIGARYISDSSQIELFPGKHSAVQRLQEKYPDFQIDFIDSTANEDKYLVRIGSPSDPGGYFLLDPKTLGTSKLVTLYDGLSAQNVGAVLNVRYTARDGQKIPAYVTLPPTVESTPKNLPFIVLPHGGPYARDDKRFDYLAQFFATRGYGVLQMNFRGSEGYGRSYEEAGRENWVVMQEDVEDGMRWLLRKGYADPKRTCIAGWSYGGYAALMGSINHPELYNCTISMAGVTDLIDLKNDMEKYRFGDITSDFFLRGLDGKKDMKANSPVKRASELKNPVFLAHGTLDQRVHFDQFKRMKSALKKSSAKVTAIEFKDEDHFLSNKANRVKFFVELEKFLEKANGKSEYATP